MYELGKELNWNVESDLDWSPEFEGISMEEFDFEDNQWANHPVYKKMPTWIRKEFFHDLNCWATSQFLHGEQGALLVASQLASCAPTYNAKLYAASQTFDEARHVEAFNKYIQTRLKKSWPIGFALKGLLDKILTDHRWDLKFIGMQVVIEGLALAAFQAAKEGTSDPVYKQMLENDYIPHFQLGHPGSFELAERVSRILPEPFNHVFFVNSGSESVDTALKIALAYQRNIGQGNRTRFVGRERGYHGVGFGGISVGGISPNRKMFGNMLTGIDHLKHTHNLEHNAFVKGQPEWGAHLADDLESIVALHDASNIAAVIVEPVAGSTGVLIPPQGLSLIHI